MENLVWGLQMTALGMGLVFGLLAMLWALLTLVLRMDKPGDPPAPAPEAASTVLAPPDEGAPDIDPEWVAAILVATHLHRSVRRREAAPVMRSYLPGTQLFASRWLGAGRSRQNQTWNRRPK